MKYFVLSALIFLLGIVGFLEPVRFVFQKGLTPVQLGLQDTAMGISEAFHFFTRMEKIRKENVALIKENRELKSAILDIKKYELENKTLKEQLNLKETDSFDRELLLTSVLGNPADLSYSTVYIDKGFKHEVSIGDMVIVGNYLIGKVREVTFEKSLVDLVTSPNFSATVLDLDSSSKTEGVCVGKYGLYMEMTRILQSDEINVGDTIVTSGKDGVFLSGFAVGKVSSISDLPAEPLRVAQLEPLIDLKSLSKVFVVLSK